MRFALLIGMLVALASPSRALAQEAPITQEQPTPEARVHFEAAASHFARGDYEAALREFDTAYAMTHAPALLFNMALCYERTGRYAEAADHFERFAASGARVDEPEVLTERVRRLRERAAPQTIPVDSPAPEQQDAELAATTQPASNPWKGVAIGSLVVGGVGLAAFGVMGALALAEHDVRAADCDAVDGCAPSDLDTLRAFSLGADVSLAVGSLAVVLGGVAAIVFASQAATADEGAISIAPIVGPTALGVGASGRW